MLSAMLPDCRSPSIIEMMLGGLSYALVAHALNGFLDQSGPEIHFLVWLGVLLSFQKLSQRQWV